MANVEKRSLRGKKGKTSDNDKRRFIYWKRRTDGFGWLSGWVGEGKMTRKKAHKSAKVIGQTWLNPRQNCQFRQIKQDKVIKGLVRWLIDKVNNDVIDRTEWIAHGVQNIKSSADGGGKKNKTTFKQKTTRSQKKVVWILKNIIILFKQRPPDEWKVGKFIIFYNLTRLHCVQSTR